MWFKRLEFRIKFQPRTVIIMRGLPGRANRPRPTKFPNAVVCSADSFFLDRTNIQICQLELQQAHRSCFRAFINYRGAETIVIDNTNTCSWEYENYVHGERSYSIRIIRMNFSESDITLFGNETFAVPFQNKRNVRAIRG